MPIRRIEFIEREKCGFGRRVENGCVERFLKVAAVVAGQDGHGRVVDLSLVLADVKGASDIVYAAIY